jgi:hypothetical protein
MRKMMIIIFILFNSCSTIRMKYVATVKDMKNGNERIISNQINVKSGGIQPACWITGIIYGGACWGYLLTPYEQHITTAKDVGRHEIRWIYGEDRYQIISEDIQRLIMVGLIGLYRLP